MKVGIFLALLLALSMGTTIASETKLGAEQIDKLTNFAVEMLKGPTSCKVCRTLEGALDFDLALFFLDWQPAGHAICNELSKKYKMSADNCFNVIKRYIVGIKASFYRLETQARSNFFCGYIFGLCETDRIKKISVKPIIEELYKDQPAPQEPVPTGKNTIKILQFSDPHLDNEYTPGAIEDCTGTVVCCRKDNKPRDPNVITKAGYWGSHIYQSCDLPLQTFEAFLRFAKKEVDPDIIVWTGDNEHHQIDTVTEKYNFDITKYIADKTKETFPDKRIQFCVGNHEHFPVDNLDMVSPHETKGVWFYENFTSAYQTLFKNDSSFLEFKNRGFYSEYISEFNIRFINMLSAPMETYNFYLFVYKFDPTGQFRWMWETLREAEKNGEFVYITIHIPPGGDGSHQLWDELFNDTIERFRNTIRGIFAGHTHTDKLKWTRERADNSKIVQTIYISNSLTTFGGMQPSFRVYEVDKDSGVIVDMVQYRLDLEKWNAEDPSVDPTWDVIYRFKDAYQMTDMSRNSMQQLYDNLMNDRQPYLNTYLDHLKSGRTSDNWSLQKMHLNSNDYLGLHCDFNVEVKQFVKCIGWRLFTDWRGDWLDLFMANMFTHYMEFN